MTIQAIFFDMGGTIETFSFTPELRLKATPGIRQLLDDAGIHIDLPDEQLRELISGGLKSYHQVCTTNLDELPSFKVWSEFIFKDLPIDRTKLDSIAEDLMLYVETKYFRRAMRPEVPFVLEEIQKMGLKIGLISNVNSRGQVPANLTDYAIRAYFDPVVLSSEYGRRKPDPSIFHFAARLANVPTGACAYIGDRIERDIKGARKAGFRLAIQIRHDYLHGEEDTGATPDAVIDNMTELLDLLRAEQNRPVPKINGIFKGLLFDAGDILYYRTDRWVKFYEFLYEIGLEIPEGLAEKRELLTQQAYRGGISQEEYRASLLQLFGITRPDQVERGLKILDDEDNDVTFFEGVPETLLALKEKGYRLGIVTDTANPIHVKLCWFEKGGFGHVWDSIISSSELKTRKPDPGIYQAALQHLGLTANEVVFVGHKISELDGARAVGMKTIAFNYEESAQADYYIDHFTDLLRVRTFSERRA